MEHETAGPAAPAPRTGGFVDRTFRYFCSIHTDMTGKVVVT